MFQLDGQITYPCSRVEDTAQAAETQAPEDSKAVSKYVSSIKWEGWWHYSTKQPKSSSSHSSFKYTFVGPHVSEQRPLLAVESGSSTTSGNHKSDQPGSGGQNSPRGSSGEVASNSQSASQANPEVAVAQASTAARETPTVASGEQEERPSSSEEQLSQANNAPSAPDKSGQDGAEGGSDAVPARAAAASAAGTQASERQPVDMSLYGPGGDGRLPSGTWSGQFAVKNGRGGEIMVSESFVLEFGSGKGSRPQAFSTSTSKSQPVADSTGEASPRAPTSAPEKIAESSGDPTKAATDPGVPTEAEKSVPSSAEVEPGNSIADQERAGSAGVGTETSKSGVDRGDATGATSAAGAATAAPESAIPVAPVVRVSGWGHNRYGHFTLNGGHERATGRLDLTRIYLNTPKTSTSSGPQATRSEGTSVSHQKRRRSLPPGATPPPPPGPSLAKRRTKRTRCPNQRLVDDESTPYGQSEGAGSSGGLGRRKSSSDIGAGSGTVLADASAGLGLSAGGMEAGVPNETPRRGTPGPKPRKQRDRSRDLIMEQSRRARKKGHQQVHDVLGSGVESFGEGKGIAPLRSTAEAAAAELAARAKAGREALAGADLASLIAANSEDDQVVKEAIANMEKEQAGLEAEAAAAAAAAVAVATAAATATAAEGDADGEAAAQAPTAAATIAATAEGSRVENNGVSGGSSRGSKRSRAVQEERWRSISLDEETGEVYEGEVFRGKRHGQGMCVYANKNIYEGDWRFGKEHGIGQIMRPDRKVIYAGEFVDGKFCGKGRFVDETGDVYDGDWKDSLRHGFGKYTFTAEKGIHVKPGAEPEKPTTYKGDFKDNLRCGRGVMSWPGGKYDGEWLNDAKHGRGVLTTADGFLYDGCWVDDLPEGRGSCVHPDGQKYLGIFKGGKKEGRGTLDFSNGASYEGRFRDDAIDGQGMLRIPEVVRDEMGGWMIPIEFQSDMERIHQRSGFDIYGS